MCVFLSCFLCIFFLFTTNLCTCLEATLGWTPQESRSSGINTSKANIWCCSVLGFFSCFFFMGMWYWTAARDSWKSQQLSWRSWHSSKGVHETEKQCVACCLASSPTYTQRVFHSEDGRGISSKTCACVCTCACQRTTTWFKRVWFETEEEVALSRRTDCQK